MTAAHRDEPADLPASDDDERLGEAIEAYLALVEQGRAPEPEAFAARYPDLGEDIRAALEGLELVHGLVGQASSGPGAKPGGGRGLESGRRIAGYRIVRELGRGGMGTVYEAVHVGLDRPVALKVLGTHAAPDSSARRRFLNEARTAAGLHHTHIVPVFDVGQAGGLCYYAMQRIEGSGLDRVVRHLRRTRSLHGPAGSKAEGAPGSSSLKGSASGSRLNRLWVRVSEGWPWAQPRHIPVSEFDRGGDVAVKVREAARPPAREGLASGARGASLPAWPSAPPADSTTSWIAGGHEHAPESCHGPGGGGDPGPLGSIVP